MEKITTTISYGGAKIETIISQEENPAGTLYLVDMNGNYGFTLLHDEDDEWSIQKEADASVPFVEEELYDKIIKKLQYELRYAA
ncbi:hypothetical protein [Ferruginibacter sp. HRS2-29]|uniref:hypothetical protein n=1 Tax=Ferruginibacter sp. HRS2-29 TaxID=2487334 RepID=UPI0020CCC198|nr:hypothetical protein [Ferruginibacter sp. HRS2-29]MCP9749550.1 hypothetical protein [Ferruginibacter sp. HRS2-29]